MPLILIGEHGTTTEMFLAWFGDSKLGGSTCIGKTGKIGKIGKRRTEVTMSTLDKRQRWVLKLA